MSKTREEIKGEGWGKIRDEIAPAIADKDDLIFLEIVFNSAFDWAQKHPRIYEPPLSRCPDNTDEKDLWEHYWKGVIGGADDPFEQIKKELADLYVFGGFASQVYYAVTGGVISKPNTCPSEVIRLFEEQFEDRATTRIAIADIMREEGIDDSERLRMISEYFELDDVSTSGEVIP